MIRDIFGEAVVAILDEWPNKCRFIKELSLMFPKGFIDTDGKFNELPKGPIAADYVTFAQEGDNMECPAD